ncbi:hypothetical protein P4534_08075 [Peribacillus butanolivorans]|uniref:hypothetical protein n=1 Tax=Peribacillus butanolivorans TaxID=421767 RepID=UPI00070FDC4D|nr:hypothetical protein [Peribacillus butanolivorans]KRF58921.1 hypothetical protein ASG99_27240 [Bacillus sp. Soil768D1]MED3688767.1 hypothetical protein [Peribacillus butanolivorans]
MVYQVRLLKGILEPHRSRYQLQNAEAVTRLGWKLLLLYFLSFIVFAVEGYFGVGSESFSKEITKMDASEFEMGKLLIIGGNIIAGLFYPTIYLFLSSLFFWIVIDIPYIKLVIVQMIIFGLQLLEKVFLIPILVLMDIGNDANPFSLGVISQYFLRSDYFIHFFSEITIFQFLIIALQYFYLKEFSERNNYLVLLMIVLFYLATWFVKAFLAYIQVGVFV